ncbi:MAG: hypothetical protein AAFO75_03185 [Pseudomonadota bacterium]
MSALEQAPPEMTLFGTLSTGEDTLPLLRSLMLVRVACPKGATLTEVVRDYSPLVSHRYSPAEWRADARQELAALIDAGLAQEYRLRVTATDAGRLLADAFLGRKDATKSSWSDVRDGRLIAKGLGLETIGPKRLADIMRPDGLRGIILQKAFGLSQRVRPTPAKLRAALARVALERSFGDKVRSGLSDGNGFTASAGRLLAGQLARRPRTFHSDSKLIATLAAEAIGARQTDLESLRSAVLRSLFTQALGRVDRFSVTERTGPQEVLQTAQSAKPAEQPNAGQTKQDEAGQLSPVRVKPTLAAFANGVSQAAQTCAEGWPGNYKALIAKVWEVVEHRHPEWGLNDVAFKCMLTEAHLAGLVELAGVDLKSADHRAALEASEISYKNTVWHQVRLQSDP